MLKRAVEGMSDTNVYAGITGLGASIMGYAVNTAERAVASWLWTKHKIMKMHPDYAYYPNMPRRRFAALMLSIISLFVFWGGIMHLNGNFAALASGDPVEWGSLLLSLVLGKIMIDRQKPTLEEAQAAAEEQDG
jgi:hypothetical protein